MSPLLVPQMMPLMKSPSRLISCKYLVLLTFNYIAIG